MDTDDALAGPGMRATETSRKALAGPLARRRLRAMQKATIPVRGLKVTVPLSADTLPRNLVPMDGPAGEPVIDLALEGSTLTVRARINGKNYRKMLKQIDEHGPANVVVVMQGTLRPPAAPGDPLVLDSAGFQVNVKTPKPADPVTG
jgi:hypothetical protein